MPSPVTRALVTMLLAVTMAGCAPTGSGGFENGAGGAVGSDPGDVVAASVAAGVPLLRPVVLGTLPHDTEDWTEGLEIADGVLYESTGLAGHSRLRTRDPNTGVPLRSAPLPDRLYGEGITVLPDRIWQLTWKDGVAVQWDRASLTPVRQLPWSGEGWGLCHTSDQRVIASDGSDRLRVLSGTELAPLGEIRVRIAGRALTGLNELECVPGAIWANVYPTGWLVRIDPATGDVTHAVDASGLLPPDQRAGTDVLNGIASIPGTDEFLLTGKLCPTMFRVRFVPG